MVDTTEIEEPIDVVETLVFRTKDKVDETEWEPDEYRFKLPDDPTDTTYVARRPKRATFLLLQASFGRRARTADMLHEMFRFVEVALVPESARVIEDRLDDPDDTLEAEDVIDIMLTLIKRWSEKDDVDGKPRPARERRR